MTETIIIDFHSLESMEAAERKKAELENEGYELHHTGGSITRRILTYKKIQ